MSNPLRALIALADAAIEAAIIECGNDPALRRLPRDKLRELFLLQMGHTMQDIAGALKEKNGTTLQ